MSSMKCLTLRLSLSSEVSNFRFCIGHQNRDSFVID
jgi:hypothetical protein